MGQIAIFCDGTWNNASIKQPTHVHRMARTAGAALGPKAKYFAGVGTGRRQVSRLGKLINRIGGGAFGWGLNGNITECYAWLCRNYVPGDKIYLFGFSRGAYTARSLAGMIRKCGVMDDVTDETLARAVALYRKPGAANHPDALHILEERRVLSPRFATSAADLDWRAVTPQNGGRDSSIRINITYLGVWDTVGALGVPTPLFGPLARLLNSRYTFHDTDLSSMVKSARHAVALDERRTFYKPALWDNLEQSRKGKGLNRGDRSPQRPYQQVWFTGTHAIVGGSSRARPLAAAPLEWVAQGAIDAGLGMPLQGLSDVPSDPLANSQELTLPPLFYQVAKPLARWRKGPGHPIDLHASADLRVRKRHDYRPRSLRALFPDLFGNLPLVP